MTTNATAAISKMTAALEAVGDDSFAELGSLLSGVFEQMDWAEDEIKAAQKRHPATADLLYHSFKLLCAPHELMAKEHVYRAHCRELLDRVAAGADTRPGTAAQVCIACSESSNLAPLTSTATGLYARMWQQAFPRLGMQWDDVSEHYEALRGAQIDDAEQEMRRKLADPERRITEIDCKGMHHGETVNCTAQAPGKRAGQAAKVAA
jgi:hypothetical protein